MINHNQQNIFCPMCHNTPQVCQCNPTTIIPADEEQLKRIAKLVEPKKEWVGLTEEDIAILWKATPLLIGVYSYTDIAREVEAKLKEKNT
jgi:hypothetical protein